MGYLLLLLHQAFKLWCWYVACSWGHEFLFKTSSHTLDGSLTLSYHSLRIYLSSVLYKNIIVF